MRCSKTFQKSGNESNPKKSEKKFQNINKTSCLTNKFSWENSGTVTTNDI